MSFLDKTEWGDGAAALSNLVSFGTEPLMRMVMLYYDQEENTEFILMMIQEKVEDMEKNIKRFLAELEENMKGEKHD